MGYTKEIWMEDELLAFLIQEYQELPLIRQKVIYAQIFLGLYEWNQFTYLKPHQLRKMFLEECNFPIMSY